MAGSALGVGNQDVSTANPLPVTLVSSGGSSVIGTVAIDQTTPGTTNAVVAVGNVAHDAVDSGNPLKVGGKANSSAPAAVAVGDRVDAWYTLTGRTTTSGVTNTTVSDGGAASPSIAETGNARAQAAAMLHYNPTADGWDRQRGNHEVTALASAARTASVNSSDLINYNARGVTVTIDATANASAAGITVVVKYKDTLSGKYVTLLTSATLFAATTTGTVSLMIYPGLVAAANLNANAALPRIWRVEVTHGDASSITYSIGANYIN